VESLAEEKRLEEILKIDKDDSSALLNEFQQRIEMLESKK
jgi:hypothetical protein